MRTREIIARQVEYLVSTDCREGLASYIENGGDLSEIGDRERQILARLVRGLSPRKRGEHINSNEERDHKICCDIAYLCGHGLPAYTDSGVLKDVPGVEGSAEDACTVIAERWDMNPERVRKIWAARESDDALLKRRKEMGQQAARRGLP